MARARNLVRGIEDFPELEQQMDAKLRSLSGRRGCSRCDMSKLIRSYRQRVEERRGVTKGQNQRRMGS